jgi:S1-C subfamily serine protease
MPFFSSRVASNIGKVPGYSATFNSLFLQLLPRQLIKATSETAVEVPMKLLVFFLSLFTSFFAIAEEGMWTLDNLPLDKLEKTYSFSPDQKWLKHVQLSSVRLANGCSGSFVSQEGLVLTNHHCARGCIQNLSSDKSDLMANGFNATTVKTEKKCPGLEVNRLLEVTDVTDKILATTKGLTGKKFSDARKAEMARLEKGCAKDPEKFRCDTVSLYQGGQYKLYRYRRYQDVRLVFAPESQMGHFGGDPDNFNFPRYSFDMSLLRVYENGQPLDNKNWLAWSKTGVKKGDMTLITGHPGRTSRLEPIAVLEYWRDRQMPQTLVRLSELRGLLHQFGRQGKEAKRISKSVLQGVENGFKAYWGRLKALNDKTFMATLKSKEQDLRHRVQRNRWYRNKYGDAWLEIDKALQLKMNNQDELNHIAYGDFGTKLFSLARGIVRHSVEKTKPNEKRLEEYTDSKWPSRKRYITSPAPIYKQLEVVLMEHGLTKMREDLSPDHPFVKQVLGVKSPAEVAQQVVLKTKLTDPKYREKLLGQSFATLKKSKDPMIQLALQVDAKGREVRKLDEEQIEPLFVINKEKIAKAMFEIYGTDRYPDATFSLRLTFGQVKGFPVKGRFVEPHTVLSGLYQRATGRDPFRLAKSWKRAEKSMDPETPFNFSSTNDIIGGNSGSPVIDRKAEVVGLVFDGNIHSLGGAFGYDERQNRAVSVHSQIMLEALEKVYKADRIVQEIQRSQTAEGISTASR